MAALPTDSFWMVYGLDAGPPTKRHAHRVTAVAEMRRLARANPGKVFVLLESVGAAVKDDIRTVIFGGREDHYLSEQSIDSEIPF